MEVVREMVVAGSKRSCDIFDAIGRFSHCWFAITIPETY